MSELNLFSSETQLCGGVTLFTNNELGSIRIVIKNNEPMFCLVDIAKALEHTNPRRIKEWLDSEFGDGVTESYPIIDSLNRKQNATFITEPQLYYVLARTNSQKAKPFRMWVNSEVLPSIRKNGGYISGQESLTDEQLLAKALLVANNVIQNKDRVIKQQKEIIDDQKQVINAYQVTDKVRRNKQEIATLLNKKIRELAETQYGRRYNEAYLSVYDEFAKLHCFNHKIDMKFLRTNIDYLSECLKIVLERLV